MTKLRLLLFPECNRSCEGCCNKDWDLDNIPVNIGFDGYEMILLTGGEPMLSPLLVADVCRDIRQVTDVPIILYTAKSKRPLDLVAMLNWVDGITLTLHEQYDVKGFQDLDRYIMLIPHIEEKSLRLNIFSNVDMTGVDTYGWTVQDNMVWVKDCPLPEGEVLQRLTPA